MQFRPSRSMSVSETWGSLDNYISTIAKVLALEVL